MFVRYGVPQSSVASGKNRQAKLNPRGQKEKIERQRAREADAAAFREREAQREAARQAEAVRREERRKLLVEKEKARRDKLERERIAEQEAAVAKKIEWVKTLPF